MKAVAEQPQGLGAEILDEAGMISWPLAVNRGFGLSADAAGERAEHRDRHWEGVRTCILLVLLVLAGCRPKDGVERVHLKGAVTYKGQPLASGRILISPLPGTNAPVTIIDFKDGRYDSFDQQGKGVPVGKHRVEINAYAPADLAAKNTNDFAPPPPSLLPAKYNDESTLTLDLPSGSDAEMVKDFTLE